MYERYYKDTLKLYPSLASYLGDRSRDDRVEISIAPSFRERIKRLIAKYDHALKDTTLSSQTHLDSRLLRYEIDMYKEGLKHPFYLMPITSFSNPVMEFDFLERTVYTTAFREARYKCYARYLKQAMINMRQGIEQGYVIPRRICELLIADIKNFIATSATALSPEYTDAIVRLLSFLEDTYLSRTRESVGLCDLPNGKEMYAYLVKEHTTLSGTTPESVHAYGLREVRRLRRVIAETLKKTPYKTLAELKTDPQNFYHSVKEVMTAYQALQKRIHDQVIPTYFTTQVTPYSIKPIPRVMQDNSPGAFYMASTKTRPGVFYVNTRDTKENPKYAMETLTMHEGEPGHHYQFQYMIEKGVPEHRIHGSDSTAFVEGWALYAESLSTSQDPLTQLGRLTYDMFRAVRCVVDTGLHYYGWSYDRCLKYMKRHIALNDSELETELNRYICIPGQAVAYKVGERFFHEQRRRCSFKDIKEYHDAVLCNGVLPLDLLLTLLHPGKDRGDHE
jgi:prolyl oligopeptidase